MKNLYTKSKGKIHPSPAPASSGGGGGGGGGSADALAVLTLLPAAIFAMTAVLAAEDKEVLAYLMIRSIEGSGPAADERRRCRRGGGGVVVGPHRPLFDCGCFECYTSFWWRWDRSRDREAIHMAIEAFEDHLASKEKRGKETKRKRKKNKDEKREKRTLTGNEGENGEKLIDEAAVVPAEENKGFEEEAVIVSDGCFAEKEEEKVEVSDEPVELPAVSGEKRRGWADFVAMFNSRLWNLWGPEE